MGSLLKGVDWPKDKRDALTKAFGRLKVNVLWKYENETLPNQPKNVRVGKWFPQRDVLAHPNVKIFISHGGNLGTTEALARGKPVLIFPIYADQVMNAARIVESGYGQKLNFESIDEENVFNILTEMLDNPQYYEKATEISQRFHDRPATPSQTVVFWTEYVIRHHGAPQLKSPGNDLTTIEFYLLDVYALMLVIILVILKSLQSCIKFARENIIGSKKQKIL